MRLAREIAVAKLPPLMGCHLAGLAVADSLEIKDVCIEAIRYGVCRNPDQVRRDAHLDETWVLETSSHLSAPNAAKASMSLCRVELVPNAWKSPLELRPVRHWAEPRIRGHTVVFNPSFLLRTMLERRLLEEATLDAFLQDVLDALHQVQDGRVDVKHIPIQLVKKPPALPRQAFQSLGTGPPPRLWKVARASPRTRR